MDHNPGVNIDRFGRERRVEVLPDARRRQPGYDGYNAPGLSGFAGNVNSYQARNYDYNYRAAAGINAGYDRSSMYKAVDDILKSKKGFYEQPQPLQFAEFLQMLGLDQDPKIAAEKYEDYKRQFEQKRCSVFYETHKKDGWFREKYDPELSNPIQTEAAKVYEKNYELFLEDWQNGVFANFSLDKISNIPKKEDSAMQGVEGSTADDTKATETTSMEMEVKKEGSNDNINGSEEGAGSEESWNNIVDTCLRTATEDTTAEQLKKLSNAVVVLNLNSSITRDQLKSHVSAVPEVVNVYMSDPNVFKKYNRIAWLILKDDANSEEVVKLLNENYSNYTVLDKKAAEAAVMTAENDDTNVADLFTLKYAPASRFPKIRYTPEVASTEIRIRKDLTNVLMIYDKLSKEFTFIKSLPFTDFPYNTIQEAKQLLDWYVVFLRRVFFFCYYSLSGSVGLFDYKLTSADAFIQKNCLHFWRRVPDHDLSEEEIRKFNAWETKLDQAVLKFLADEVDPNELRLLDFKSPETLISEWFNKNIEKVEESKFRCKMPNCTKMFKGEEFVEKHIRNKHSDYYNDFVKDVEMKARYLKDPTRPTFTVAYQIPISSYTSGHSHFRGNHAGGRQPYQRRQQNNSRYTPYGSAGPARHRNQAMRGPGGRKLTSYVDLDAPPTEQKIELDYD